ncbi:hypothetical protein D3C78_1947010 [compost metagenome]
MTAGPTINASAAFLPSSLRSFASRRGKAAVIGSPAKVEIVPSGVTLRMRKLPVSAM